MSIYNRHKQTLFSMLSSCNPVGEVFEESDDVWKVLVYDAVGRDILAPLFSVTELRSTGVTLHMLLDNTRHPIPDVPAVYFVEPTKANLSRIASDAAKGTYGRLWINFTGFISRKELECLAESLATAARANPLNGRIGYVYDRYACFHSLQHNLFSLNLPGIYAALNATYVTNDDMNSLIIKIVDRLFCAVVTLGVIPVIRAQKGGPAILVATMLDSRIREHLEKNNNTFVESKLRMSSHSQRPLLVVVDRAIDLPVMLHHSWTYQALAHDVFGFKLNRVTVPVREGEEGTREEDRSGARTGVEFGTECIGNHTFDLSQLDAFWLEHAGLPFPVVAESLEAALQAYKDEVNDLNQTTNTIGQDNVAAENIRVNSKATASRLAAAVSNLPELAKKKRTIDMHTNIASALLDEIKNRGLDGYFQVEEEMISRPSNFDVERILALIRDARGSASDKLRMFLIYYLCIDSANEDDIERCVTCLKSAGCVDFRAYNYLKSVRAYTRRMSNSLATPLSTSSSIGGVYAASVLDTLSQVASNVNRLILSSDKGLVAAHDVYALMEAKVDLEIANRYTLLDPKSPEGCVVSSGQSSKEAILFVVGPGNYIEFQNCQDYICNKAVQDGKRGRMIPNGRTVVYGATELCNGGEFLDQLHLNGVA